jgi:hypothetical protein
MGDKMLGLSIFGIILVIGAVVLVVMTAKWSRENKLVLLVESDETGNDAIENIEMIEPAELSRRASEEEPI